MTTTFSRPVSRLTRRTLNRARDVGVLLSSDIVGGFHHVSMANGKGNPVSGISLRYRRSTDVTR
jgi:hypothetical protein